MRIRIETDNKEKEGKLLSEVVRIIKRALREEGYRFSAYPWEDDTRRMVVLYSIKRVGKPKESIHQLYKRRTYEEPVVEF